MVDLKGDTGQGEMHQITAKSMGKLLKKGKALLAHLFTMEGKEDETNEEVPEEVQQVLESYASVFEESKSLPPSRDYHHAIPIVPGAKLVSLSPYRSLGTGGRRSFQSIETGYEQHFCTGYARLYSKPLSLRLMLAIWELDLC